MVGSLSNVDLERSRPERSWWRDDMVCVYQNTCQSATVLPSPCYGCYGMYRYETLGIGRQITPYADGSTPMWGKLQAKWSRDLAVHTSNYHNLSTLYRHPHMVRLTAVHLFSCLARSDEILCTRWAASRQQRSLPCSRPTHKSTFRIPTSRTVLSTQPSATVKVSKN